MSTPGSLLQLTRSRHHYNGQTAVLHRTDVKEGSFQKMNAAEAEFLQFTATGPSVFEDSITIGGADGATADRFITHLGQAGHDLTVTSAGSLVVQSTEPSASDAIRIQTTGAGGGIQLMPSGGDVTVTADDLVVSTGDAVVTAGDVTVTAGDVSVAAGNVVVTAGNVAMPGGGPQSLAHTGAAGNDLTVFSVAGSAEFSGGENVSDAVRIRATGASGGIAIASGNATPSGIAGGIQLSAGTGDVVVDDSDFLVSRAAGTEAQMFVSGGDNSSARIYSLRGGADGWDVFGPAGNDRLLISGAGSYTDTVAQVEHDAGAAQGIFQTRGIGVGLGAETLVAAGAAAPEVGVSIVDSTVGAIAITLADGAAAGQLKHFVLAVDGGDVTITPATTLGSWASVVLKNVGDTVTMVWTASGWANISYGSGIVAAAADILNTGAGTGIDVI